MIEMVIGNLIGHIIYRNIYTVRILPVMIFLKRAHQYFAPKIRYLA